MKALDTSDKTIGMAKAIASQGYQAVGVYLRPDRCSAAMIAELHSAGLKIWSMYEKGYPTSDAYFSQTQGIIDGHAAAAFAKQIINQPAGSQIYATVDYDPDDSDPSAPTINGVISEYMAAFKAAVGASGYLASVYGSGRTCRILTASGLAKSGWLCVSSCFAEHDTYKPNAVIVQQSVINGNWDGDDIQKPDVAGLW